MACGLLLLRTQLKHTMKTSLLAAPLLGLLACPGVSPGASPKLDESALAEMRKGQTTFDDIVRRFGRPNFGSTNWDGTRTAAYAYGDGWSPAALSALGAAMGGSSADTVVLYFNDKGVLTDYRINQAAVKNGDSRAAPAARYVEPSFGGSAPTSAAKPAAASPPIGVRQRPLPSRQASPWQCRQESRSKGATVCRGGCRPARRAKIATDARAGGIAASPFPTPVHQEPRPAPAGQGSAPLPLLVVGVVWGIVAAIGHAVAVPVSGSGPSAVGSGVAITRM